MAMAEVAILTILALTFILIMIRCFGIKEGKIVKGYDIGQSMTIGSRQVQEDQLGISRTPHGLLAVLADGMGKNFGGKIAGKIAVDTIKTMFASYNAFENPVYFFKRSFQAVNREILKELDEGRGSAGVAAAVIQEDKLYYALVGNIKIAVFRNGNLVPLSNGHTLYKYLGQDGFQDIEFFDTPITLKAEDIVVIMSDGIFEGLTWKEIEESLSRNTKCQAKAWEIVEMINTSGKKDKDNASIILIKQP